MEQIKEGSTDLSLAIVPVSSAACFRVRIPNLRLPDTPWTWPTVSNVTIKYLVSIGLLLMFSSFRCMQDETPVAKSMQTSIARFLCPKGKNEVYHGKTLMPVNTKQITDAWNSRTREFMVINNTAVSSVRICNTYLFNTYAPKHLIRSRFDQAHTDSFYCILLLNRLKSSDRSEGKRRTSTRGHSGSRIAAVQ
jgi:hypothetical protein